MEERSSLTSVSGQWPTKWFRTSTTGDEPWIFYMSAEFIPACLTTMMNGEITGDRSTLIAPRQD